MSDEQRISEELEKYLDQPDSYTGNLDPQTKEVADSLRQAARQPSPRAGFVNELAQRLQERNQEIAGRPRRRLWQMGRRLALVAAGLAAVLLFAFYVSSLFREPEVEPAVSDLETPAPAIVRQATAGGLEGVEFHLAEPLPDEGGEIALYEAMVSGVPATPEEALALARALGMENPQLYETSEVKPQWTAIDDRGRTLRWVPFEDQRFSSPQRPQGSRPASLSYSIQEIERLSAEGDPLAFDEAARIAEEFLRSGDLLPAEYEVQDGQSIVASALRLVEFRPLVDGHPVSGYETTIRVMVMPDGTVSNASVLPLAFTSTGETMAVRSAREAFDDAINGIGGFGYSFDTQPADGQQTEVYFPVTSLPRVGDSVTLRGWLSVYRPLGQGNPRVLFQASANRATYELRGPLDNGLMAASSSEVEITGIVEEVAGAGPIPLEVQSWHSLGSAPQPATCLVGTFRREGETGRLEADDGNSYLLSGVPQKVNDGQRAEVCGEFADSGDPRDWQSIAVPPFSENPSGSGGGGGGQSVAVGQTVAVTRTIESDPESSAPQGASGVEVAVPVARPQEGDSPFEIGQEVSTTGQVQGFRRNVEGEPRPVIQFMVDADDDPLTPALPYPLQAEDGTLEEISQYFGLHLTIDGIVVPGEDQFFGPDQQSILVQGFQQPRPEEKLQRFLGHMQTETLEGREVTTFTNEQSGTRYVLAQGYGNPDPEERVLIVGAVHPQATFAQLPLLQPVQVRMGSDVDAAEVPSDIPVETEMPTVEMGSSGPLGSSGMPQTLLIDRVVLGYSLSATRPAQQDEGASSPALTPMWLFYGHSLDGYTSFVLEVPAARR